MSNQFEAAQKKIELEQNARRVLLHMVQHQERNPNGSFSDGLIWTTRMISEHLRLSESKTTEVIQYLLGERLIERRGDEWFISEIAADVIKSEIKCASIFLGATDSEFRDEALTGITPLGRRSSLTNAALPSCLRRPNVGNKVEREMHAQVEMGARLEQVAARYDVSTDTVREWLVTGELHHCGCCGDDFARFHRRPVGNWGEWQSHCIECRKKLRKEKTRKPCSPC